MLDLPVECQTSGKPFPGLRSFSQSESDLFFGREGQSDEIARKLGQSHFVAVVGTSGSGKSSLVRAGLLPCLESGCLVSAGSNWRFVDLRPAGRPIDSLAVAFEAAKVSEGPVDPGALQSSSLALVELTRNAYRMRNLAKEENLLVLVDQFEELFRYKSRKSMADRDEKAAFVKLLLEVSRQREFPVYVVITMRSDFLGDCARFRDLPEAMNAGQYLIPRMTRDQRREAIEGPIHMAGSTISARLVQRILNDAGEDPSQLPVMQHALMRTWNDWREKGTKDLPVDIENYEAIGGLQNALSSHLDKAYDEACRKLPNRGHQIVKRVFQRLCERDSLGRETRRPTPLCELSDVAEASKQEVLDVLECYRRETRSFVMPPLSVDLSDDREVDITHEAVLAQWARMQGPPSEEAGWLAEEEDSRRAILRLADRAEQQTKEESDYLRGPLLRAASDWWEKRKPNEAWALRYTPSFRAAERFLQQSQKNALKGRVWRYLKWAAIPGLAVLVGTFLVYKHRSEVATAKELLMEAKLTAPRSSAFQDDPRASALKAAESLTHHASLEAQMVLTDSLDVLPLPQLTLKSQEASSAEFSPDGNWLAVAGGHGVELYETKTRKIQNLAAESTEKASKLIFPSNAFFLVATAGGVSVWELDGKDWKRTTTLSCEAGPRTFSADRAGTLVAADCGDAVHLWTPTNSTEATREPDCSRISSLVVAPDGKRIVYVCNNEASWTIRSLEFNEALKTSRPYVLLALQKEQTQQTDESASAQQSAARPQWETWPGPPEIKDIRFDPQDSDVLLIGGSDGTVKSWSLSSASAGKHDERKSSWTANRRATLREGKRSATAPDPSALYRSSQGYQLLALESGVRQISFSEDGTWIAVADSRGTAKLWDRSEMSQKEEIAYLALDSRVTSVAVSRAEQQIAAVTEDGSVHLWGLRRHWDSNPSDFSALQSHGSYLIKHWRVAGSIFDSPSKVINTRSGRVVDPPAGDTTGNWQTHKPLTISRDGKLIATTDGTTLVVSELKEDKIAQSLWQTEFPRNVFYPTSFGFSHRSRYLTGAFGDRGNIWIAVWDLTRPASPPSRFPAAPGVTFDLSDASQSIFIAGNSGGIHQYDIVTSKEIPVDWNGHERVSTFDFSGDGRVTALAEAPQACNSEEGTQKQEAREKAAEQDETSNALSGVRILGDGRERAYFRASGCIQNMQISNDSRYLLTISDHAVQLWDLQSNPPAQKAEIHNSLPIVDASVAPDSEIVVLDRKRYAVFQWRTEDLKRSVCAQLIPNQGEMKSYQQVCPSPAQQSARR